MLGARSKKAAPKAAKEPGQKPARARFWDGESETALADTALRYLDRYDTTEQGLRRFLLRKLDPKLSPTQKAEAQKKVSALILRFVDAKILDDARYAQNLATSLRSRGGSTRRIEQKLKQRGVGGDALEALAPEAAGTELEAARTYLRKRRLLAKKPAENALAEPTRTSSKRSSTKATRARTSGFRRQPLPLELVWRNKVLAALARQGFSFDIAKRALELEASSAALDSPNDELACDDQLSSDDD